MKTKITFLSVLACIVLFSASAIAQPAIEVTAVYVYETPVSSPPTEVPGDKVTPSQVVAIGLTLKNNGTDLLIGDTIRMGWSEVPNGSLISVLSNDLLSGNSGNFIVIQSQTAPATAGPWEVCIWPTYTSKGFTNADPNVGNSCKEVEVESATGIDQLALEVSKSYFSGDVLNLELNSLQPQNLEVRLFSMNGQEVLNRTINKGYSKETVTLQTGDLQRGMYVLTIYTADGKAINQKLMK